jgi:hypothetical protein
MNDSGRIIAVVLAVAVALVLSALVVFAMGGSSDDGKGHMDPVDPVGPVDPGNPDVPDEPTVPDVPDEPEIPDEPPTPDIPDEPESPYPPGFSLDAETGTLSYQEETEWSIVDQLVEHIDKRKVSVTGKALVLDPGFYRVSAAGRSFDVIVGGTVTKSVSYEYWFDGAMHDVELTYDIDISELAGIMIENGEWNDRNVHNFEDLGREVYVNDTMESIAEQMEAMFLAMGGSMLDVQGYADFLASFAQLGIAYPERTYDWIDEEGKIVYRVDSDGSLVKRESTDYEVWGREEYWASSLETVFFCIGDCEDSAAVACALYKAAGFEAAMVGGQKHMMAGVALESFEDRDLSAYESLVKEATYRSFGYACSDDATLCTDRDHHYYGVETTKGQTPVGYLMNAQVNFINGEWIKTMTGMAGYYAV